MITALAFVCAAAVGAVTRAQIGRHLNRRDGLPLGTLVVNVTGAFLLGLMANVAGPTFTAVGIGGLGAYTTYSSFAGDTVALFEQGQQALAAGYVTATCVLGIGAAALGVAIAG